MNQQQHKQFLKKRDAMLTQNNIIITHKKCAGECILSYDDDQLSRMQKKCLHQCFTKFRKLNQVAEDLIFRQQKYGHSFDFRSQLKQGQYIDAKDSVDKWCVAQIQKIVGDMISLHYEGWGQKYDIDQRRTSAKIQPFRRQVMGYSGQNKNAIRQFIVNQEIQKQLSEQVENLIDTNLEGLGAHGTTQFLRGKLYFYVDSLLSHAELKQQHVPMILKFHDLYFSLVSKWAQLYKRFIPLIKENKETPNLYLVYEPAAIAMSYPELIDNLNKIFSTNQRHYKKLQELSQLAKKDVRNELMKSCFDSSCISSLFKILEYKDEKGRLACPFELANSILTLAKNIAHSQFENPHTEQIINIMNDRIEQINNTEIKQLEKRKVKEVLDMIVNIRVKISKQYNDVILKQRDIQQLKLAVKFLRSPYLQKRIHGLNDLKQFSKRNNMYTNNRKYQSEPVSGLNRKQFCDWLLEQNIIPLIYGQSSHVELVKRSTALLKQLVMNKKLPPQYIEILWGSTMGKHEDAVRITYDVIVDIADNLDLKLAEKLFQNIKKIKPIDYDIIKLNFLHAYTLKIKKSLNLFQKTFSQGGGVKSGSSYTNKIDQGLYYNPKIFWDILDVHHDPQIKSSASSYFCRIIQTQNPSIKSLFLDLSVKNLQDHKNFLNSLQIIIHILDSLPKQKKVILQNLKMTPNDLIKIVLKNFTIYIERVRQFLGTAEGMKIERTSIYRYEFQPKIRHSYVLETIKQALLSIVLINYSVEFKNDQIQKIWNLTIANPICDSDSLTFLKFLLDPTPNNKAGQHRSYILTESNRKFILLDIIPKSLNYKRVNNQMADHLKNLFYIVNKSQKNIIKTNNNRQYYQGKPSEFYGYDMIWQSVLHSQYHSTFQNLSKYMTDMIQNNKNPTQIKTNIQIYLNDCCQAILKQINARDEGVIVQPNEMNKLLHRLVRLLRQIVIRIEGIILAKQPQYLNPDYQFEFRVNLKVQGDQKFFTLKLNSQAHNVVHVRKRVFEKIKGLGVRGYNDFTIYADKINLQLRYDNTSLSQLENIRYWEVFYRQSAYNDTDFPRYILANNMQFLNCLFRLFTVNDIDVINETWELISLMPPNTKIKDKLSNLNISKSAGIKQWEEFLDINKNSKLLAYYLTILSEMIYTKQEHEYVIERNNYQKKNINMPMNQQQIESICKNYPKLQEKVKYTRMFIQRGGYAYVKHQLTMGKWIENNSHSMIDVKIVVLMFKILTTPLISTIQWEKDQILNIIKNIFNVLNVISRGDFTSNRGQEEKKKEEKQASSQNQQQEKEETKEKVKKSQGDDNKDFEPDSQSQQYNIHDYCEVIKFGFTLIKQLILGSNKNRPEIEETCQKFTNNILIIMVLKHKNQKIREAAVDSFFDLAESVTDFSGLMIKKLLDSYEDAHDIGQECDQYFNLTLKLMEMNMNKTSELLHKSEQFLSNMWKLCQDNIIFRTILETKSSEKDVLLLGTLKLARILLISMKSPPESLQILHSKLLRNRLFQPFTNDNVFQEKQSELFKNSDTRRAALRLLIEISNHQPGLAVSCLKHLLPFHTQDSWRKWTNSDWNIICDHKEKSDTGYVGLKNMGSTCYMNSLLQQLFMIPAFRKMILQVEIPTLPLLEGHEQPQIDEQNIIWQLKKVFGSLLMSDEQYYDPTHFVQSFKDIDGSPINPQEQRDVDEFFNMLMERVDSNLKGTPQYQEYTNTFGGNLSNELICFDCPHRSESEQPFLAMPLAVMNKKSLKESLDQYVRGDMLQGDNAYHCEKCDKKVATLKRCSTKRLPNNLLLVLKRFHFNFETMEKYKLNDYLEFPRELDMKDYSQEHLSKRDLLKKLGIFQQNKGDAEDKKQDESKANDVELTEDQMRILQKCFPDEYYKYKLKGIVVHYGEADHGHYFSFISDRNNDKSKDETWIEFNDKIVTYFNPKLISNAYGGYNSQTNRQSLQNAYILFYQRVELIDTQQLERDMEQLMGEEINLNQDWKVAQNRIVEKLRQRMKLLQTTQNDSVANMMMMMQKSTTTHQNLSNSGNNIIANGAGSNSPLKSFIQRKGIKLPKIIHEMVNQANHRFWLSQNIFNQDYIDFLTTLYEDLWKKNQKKVSIDDARSFELQMLEPPSPSYQITRFGLTVFMTTIVRYKHRRESVITFIKLLKQALGRDVAACFWIIETFSSDAVIREILLECPIMEVTHHIEGLIKYAMQIIYPIEKDLIQQICTECFVNGNLDYNRFGELFGLAIIKPEKESTTATATQDSKKEQTSTKDKAGKTAQNSAKYYPQAILKQPFKCPYLITFINACLHQIFPNLKKSDSFAYFYKIFSDFIDLGQQAKLYLLSCRTLNVFASIIQHNDKASIYAPECLRNIIQIVLPPDTKFSIGFGKIMPDDKHIYRSVQGSQKSMSYMLQTLSKLIKSCVFKEHIDNQKETSSSLNVQAPCFKLSQAQSNQLAKCLIDNRSKVLQHANSRIANRAIGEIYSHITFNNKGRTSEVVNAIFGYIDRDAQIYVQRYFDILSIVSRVKDDLRFERIEFVFQHLSDHLKRNKNFLRFCLILINFFILLAKKESTLIRKWIETYSKDANVLSQQFKRFYEDNKHVQFFGYKIYFFKKLNVEQNYFQDYLTQDFQNKLTYQIREAYDKIRKIFNGNDIKHENSYYLYDIEQVDNFENAMKGNYLDFLIYCQWNVVKVEQNTGEFMKLSYVDQNNSVIYFAQTDSDCLAQQKTMSKANGILDQHFANLYNGVYEHTAKLAAQAASRS